MATPSVSALSAPADEAPRLLDEGGLVISSYCFPPIPVGTAFLLDRMLSQLDLGETVVYAGTGHGLTTHTEPYGRTRARFVQRDVPRWWPRRDRELKLGSLRVPLRVRTLGNLLVGGRVAWDLAREIRRPQARALFAVYPTQPFLLAGCLAAMTTKKPFLVYLTDPYVEGLPSVRRVANLIERYMSRRAAVLFGLSDGHCEHIAARAHLHGVAEPNVVEIPNPYVAPTRSVELSEPLRGDPSILFTGAIYSQHADSVQRLISALESPELADLDPHFNILSQMDAEALSREGIPLGGRVSARSATTDEAQAAQRDADILFLGISFTVSEAIRRSGFPTKGPEYLAAGRPILVHAPPESYVARYARELGWAEVVSVPDVEEIARAIRRLATDEHRRAELVRNAARTLSRHDAANVAETFRRAVREAVTSRESGSQP